ncbi:MAG: hypothetical protein ACLQIK_02030 [Mycobacterium sp.]|uniref:hypothetical protein n=1 Tax=Mycobacterium sp. TaxID=1785 RepID=UPI003F9E3584
MLAHADGLEVLAEHLVEVVGHLLRGPAMSNAICTSTAVIAPHHGEDMGSARAHYAADAVAQFLSSVYATKR